MSTAQTLQVRVAAKSVEALDIVTLELVAVDGKPLPAFSAGSHVDVMLPGGQGGPGITRQYSLCNDPAEAHRYQIAVLRDPASRGGSVAVHDRVNEGDLLQISAPKNHFALAHDAKKHLLLAGGIGVTPILCMAERLAQTGADFQMHYATRAPERTAFRSRIAASGFADRVQFHYDNAEASQKLDLQQLLAKPQQGTHLYVCGPKGFMDAVLGSARAQGWPEGQLHYEFFGAAVASSDSDAGFEVKLASSGRIIQIAKDKTVTKALAEAGVDIMMSCEQGVCGTCLTRVLEGTPDHKDSYLTPEERAANDQFLPCCSRAKTPMLVLDL
ncbi:MAG: oxidoreductase [Burkholderiales bacterium]|nr:oxidoreductase [Burkholderiales bacterium]